MLLHTIFKHKFRISGVRITCDLAKPVNGHLFSFPAK